MSRQLSAGPPGIKHEKLYERKPVNDEKSGQTNIADATVSGNKVSTNRLLGIYFDPPKPDTPPLNVSFDTMHFWVYNNLTERFFSLIYSRFHFGWIRFGVHS